MSNKRYIEINSTYRNRNEWPNPSEFEVLISQSGRKFEADKAIDPVSNAAPIFAWSGNAFAWNNGTPPVPSKSFLAEVVDVPNTGFLSDQKTFVVKLNAGVFAQQLENYYVGAVVRFEVTAGGNEQRRRITRTKFLRSFPPVPLPGGQDQLQITVDSAFGSEFKTGSIISIEDPTDVDIALNGTTSFANPQFFVPDGRIGKNRYIGNILYNETINQYRTIKGYDEITHLLSVDTTGISSISSGLVTRWANNHNFSIRKEAPHFFLNGSGATTNTLILQGGSLVNDIYKDMYIRVQGSTSGATKFHYLNKIYPEQQYINPPLGEIRRIIKYEGTDNSTTPPTSIQRVTVSPPFSVAPDDDMHFEILPFSYDNFNPFIYTGSLVSQQEMVCYEIELLNLVLPNKTLNVGQGSRIAFYPYVYVEISNVSSAGAGMLNTIYSNNPNSTRMVFRATVDDTSNPFTSSYIKIDGHGMVQTLKFKPNDNLRFSVRLPNGEFFQLVEEENYSPLAPKEEIQISALFSIKRL